MCLIAPCFCLGVWEAGWDQREHGRVWPSLRARQCLSISQSSRMKNWENGELFFLMRDACFLCFLGSIPMHKLFSDLLQQPLNSQVFKVFRVLFVLLLICVAFSLWRSVFHWFCYGIVGVTQKSQRLSWALHNSCTRYCWYFPLFTKQTWFPIHVFQYTIVSLQMSTGWVIFAELSSFHSLYPSPKWQGAHSKNSNTRKGR